ncbi:MAG: heme exporter protein CcmB [Cellvibrionales bacterium]|jgi:heme exporter protein B
MRPDSLGFCRQLFVRHLRCGVRRVEDVLNSLVFFLMVVTLFPLGIGPDSNTLRELSPGIFWVVALLSALSVSGRLFSADFEDGSLEQLAVSGHPLGLCAMAEVLAHWVLSGLTLVVAAPVFALMLNMVPAAIPTLMLSLVLGTLCLSLLGGIGAALTVGVRRGALLLSLVMIPLTVPVLIFGTSAVGEAAIGYDPSRWIALMGAFAAMGLLLAPLAIGAGLRISLEQ